MGEASRAYELYQRGFHAAGSRAHWWWLHHIITLALVLGCALLLYALTPSATIEANRNAIIVGVVAAVLFGGIIVAASIKRMRGIAADNGITITLTALTWTSHSKLMRVERPWETCDAIVETHNLFLLVSDQAKDATILPKRLLQTSSRIDELRAFLASHAKRFLALEVVGGVT